MNCCPKPRINDFSFKDRDNNPFVHKYCSGCQSHLYGDKLINATDWYNWINSPTQEKQQ